MIRKPRVFVQQTVDVGGLQVAGIPAHLQHVVDDAVGALAVGLNPLQVAGQVAGDLVDVGAIVLRDLLLDIFKRFFQFID